MYLVACCRCSALLCLYLDASPTRSRSPPLNHPRRYPGSTARCHHNQQDETPSLTRQLSRSVTSTLARLVCSWVTLRGSCKVPCLHFRCRSQMLILNATAGTCSSTVSRPTVATTPASPMKLAPAAPTRLSLPRPAVVNMFPALSSSILTLQYVTEPDINNWDEH